MGKKSRTHRRHSLFRGREFCAWCNSTENLTLDHIYAKCLGGITEPSNLQVLCTKCNGIKGNIEQQIALERDPYREVRYNRQRRTLGQMSFEELNSIYEHIVVGHKIKNNKFTRRKAKSLDHILAELNSRMFMTY